MILFELLTGRLPFGERDVLFIVSRVTSGASSPDVLPSPNLPERLRLLTNRLLQKKQSDRPTATEMHETLVELVYGAKDIHIDRDSPFRGLQAFTEDQSAYFFGRDNEVAEVVERLRTEPLIPIVGTSGVGKSSFIQAGVIPRLRERAPTTVIRMRPGANPFQTLAARLGQNVAAELHDNPKSLALYLQREAEKTKSDVVLLVDQLEEVITLVADRDVRLRFLAAVCSAADDSADRVRVIFTARDDFISRLAESPEARVALSHVAILQPANQTALTEILTRTVAVAGYSYEDPSLVGRMVASVKDETAALPLLQFAGSMLWERRDTTSKQLLSRAYDDIGGVQGALATHANAMMCDLNEGETRGLRSAMLRLITPEGTRRVVLERDLLEVLGPGAAQTLKKLTDARLLNVRRSLDETYLEISHESLVHTWDRLAAWLEEGRDELVFLAQLDQAAALWDGRGRRSGEVWTGETLAEAERNLARYGSALTTLSAAFMAQSRQVQRRRKQLQRFAGVTALVVLLAGTALVFRAYQQEHAQFLALRQEQARLALLDNQPEQALVYVRDAFAQGADNPILRRMAGAVEWLMRGDKGVVARHTQAVWRTVAGGGYVATATDDTNTTVIRLSDLASRVVALGSVCPAAVYADARFIYACADGKARVVDPVAGVIESEFVIDETPAWELRGRDGMVLATVPGVGIKRLHVGEKRTSTFAAIKTLEASDVDISPDGRWVALYFGVASLEPSSLKGVQLYHDGVAQGAKILPDVVVRAAELTSDALLAGGIRGQVGLYDLAKQSWRWMNTQRLTALNHASLSPDGAFVFAAGEVAAPLDAHSGDVRWSNPVNLDRTCWDPDSRHLYGGNNIGLIVDLDLFTGFTGWRYVGQVGRISSCRSVQDNLLTTSESGTVRAWAPRLTVDHVIASLPRSHALSAPRADGTVLTMTAQGIYSVDANLMPTLIKRIEATDSDVLLLAGNSKGDYTYAIGDTLYAPLVKFDSRLMHIDISPSGQRLLALKGSSALALLDASGKETALITQGAVPWYRAVFVNEERILAVTTTGDLSLRDAGDGHVVDEKPKAHKVQAYLHLQQGRVFAYGMDSVVTEWRVDKDKLEEVWRMRMPEPTRSALHTNTFDALASSWYVLNPKGVPQLRVRLPWHDLTAAVALTDRMLYIEAERPLAEFRPPGDGTPQALEVLDRCQGLWSLEDGALTRRATESSCQQ